MQISWTGPDANGLAVTAYEIVILAKDINLWFATSTCDGSDGTIVSAKTCAVPMTTLRSAPYALVLNDEVKVKVRA